MAVRKMNGETKARRNNTLCLVGIFSLLIVIGTANVYSSTFVLDSANGTLFGYLGKQVSFFLIGLACSIVLWRLGCRFLRRWCGTLASVSILLLLLVKVAGTVVNGARRWLGYGNFTFQPSEIAKFAAVVVMAAGLTYLLENQHKITLLQRPFQDPLYIQWGSEHHLKEGSFLQRFFTKSLGRLVIPNLVLWVPFIMAGLVLLQPDMGTAIIILLAPLLVFTCSGITLSRREWIGIGVLVVIALLVMAAFGHSYQHDRIAAWLNAWDYSDNIGYQITQSLIAIGSGGVWGQGMGTGVSKFNYLPEAHTDFAFAIIAQEGGMLGGVLVIVLFVLLLHFGARTASQCRDNLFSMFLAMGISFYLCGQAFINIAMVMRILPVVGVPLPFISYGGSSLVINMMAATTLVRISYDNYRDAARRHAAGPPRPVWTIRGQHLPPR